MPSADSSPGRRRGVLRLATTASYAACSLAATDIRFDLGRSRCLRCNQLQYAITKGIDPCRSSSISTRFLLLPEGADRLLRERHPVRSRTSSTSLDAKSSAAFKAIWPIGKFPVLRDEANDRTVPESSIIIEYLAQHYPGKSQLVPADPELARRDASAGPLLRPLRERADAEDRHRQAAPAGQERSARRGGGEERCCRPPAA